MIINVDNNNSYNNFLKNRNQGQWFVWYYADWCGHCQMMKEEWNKLERTNKTNINLARVNDNFVKPEDNVQGFPTLKLFSKLNKKSAQGSIPNVIDYNSGRDEKSFQDFLRSNEDKTTIKKKKQTKKRGFSLKKPKKPKKPKGSRKKT